MNKKIKSKKRMIIESVVFGVAIPFIMYAISFMTVIVIWLNFGESASGSARSEIIHDTFLVSHLPILTIAGILIIWTRRNKNRLIYNSILLIYSIIIYIIFDYYLL